MHCIILIWNSNSWRWFSVNLGTKQYDLYETIYPENVFYDTILKNHRTIYKINVWYNIFLEFFWNVFLSHFFLKRNITICVVSRSHMASWFLSGWIHPHFVKSSAECQSPIIFDTVNFTYIKVSSFKTVEYLAKQSSAANLSNTSKFWKSKI